MKTSISRGTLDNSTGITEETLAKMLATYKNINPSWLLTGEGSMIINSSKKVAEALPKSANEDQQKNSCDKICQICNEKDRIIDSLQDQIDHYQKEIEWLRNRIERRD